MNDPQFEPYDGTPLIEKFGDVIVAHDRIKFEGGWAFKVADGEVPPETQHYVSLLMLEWAIGRLTEARAKVQTALGIPTDDQGPMTQVVGGELWTPEKQDAWEKMTPEERSASLASSVSGRGH